MKSQLSIAIQTLRKTKKWSREEMAFHMECEDSYIGQLERTDQFPPRINFLVKLSEVFKIPLSDVLVLTGYAQPSSFAKKDDLKELQRMTDFISKIKPWKVENEVVTYYISKREYESFFQKNEQPIQLKLLK